MYAGVPPGRHHHRDMHFHFAGPWTIAAKLTCLHVNKADILTLHKTFTAKRRRAENEILPDAHGKVAAVAVGKALAVNARTHLADSIFYAVDCGRIEKLVELTASFRLRSLAPIVNTVYEGRRYIQFFVH